ncbi:uncharacterized protein BYT42DRAFT_550579 [Radiomyces spectabilis]|uniref:uncharacterized protein n=1 Tax=Radiomyces spectabilis TaxID=64574 RepID=UPI002220127A|nr:uncharacterized protein BYT42DRAFT_550579 [Radiomyces spectabilis]KAI8393302.1 hypothetical protein BYT42DRAFT_550579 [Radiomyces spectabilis]
MFGCIAAGRLVQTNLQQVDVNKYVFELSDAHTINHIVVFLLGTIPFEPGFAATVHLLWPNKEWQLLGAISNEKPSAIFRLRRNESKNGPDVTMQPASPATLGISIEPIQAVEQQLSTLQQNNTASATSMSLVKPGANLTQVGQMANRILVNLYNYVTSFTAQELPMNAIPLGALTEQGYLPVKAFQTWYENLGRKLHNDPNYLLEEKDA